jgi:hypothetical protein
MSSVCRDQKTFSNAFKDAVDSYQKDEYDDMSTTGKVLIIISSFLMLIFVIWAFILSRRTKGDKVVNMVLAIVFAPAYVLSYYISNIK